jgi:hypothetical protein
LNIALPNRNKDDPRKDAKHAKFGEIAIFNFAPWRLGAIKILAVVPSRILNGRI